MNIDPSTNADGIKDIVVGGDKFKFPELDPSPSLTVTFDDPKVPYNMNILNTENVDFYYVVASYVDGSIRWSWVSKMLLK